MSIAIAHRFIAATRDDSALRARIAALGADAEIEQLVAIGVASGFAFDAETLRAAYRQDWTLRGIAAAGGKG
jgi:hypothetical protein